MKSKLCLSCSGPLDEFTEEQLKNHPEFCPNCSNSKGEMKTYEEIMDGMIEYIKNDLPEVAEKDRKNKAKEFLMEGPIWSEEFQGVIIEESLRDKSILKDLEIIDTKIDQDDNLTINAGSPVWTLHTVRFFRVDLDKVINFLLNNLRRGWYADFKGKDKHYILFKDKLFVIPKGGDYTEFKEYGKQVGIPKEQLNIEWK